jgi:hypothetical protein
MPAIDPARLTRQIEALQELFSEPAALVRALGELLEFYADRTRRPGRTGQGQATRPRSGIPPPVSRQLQSALKEQAAAHPERVWPVIDALWREEVRDMQLLAVALLSGQAEKRAATWSLEQASVRLDRPLLAALAEDGLSGWREADFTSFIQHARRWLKSDPSRLMGLLALRGACRVEGLDRLPAILESLSGHTPGLPADQRSVLQDILIHTAARSPQETAAFLLGELKRHGPQTRRLVRVILPHLPAHLRERLDGG